MFVSNLKKVIMILAAAKPQNTPHHALPQPLRYLSSGRYTRSTRSTEFRLDAYASAYKKNTKVHVPHVPPGENHGVRLLSSIPFRKPKRIFREKRRMSSSVCVGLLWPRPPRRLRGGVLEAARGHPRSRPRFAPLRLAPRPPESARGHPRPSWPAQGFLDPPPCVYRKRGVP